MIRTTYLTQLAMQLAQLDAAESAVSRAISAANEYQEVERYREVLRAVRNDRMSVLVAMCAAPSVEAA
jgi:hypothetical protein